MLRHVMAMIALFAATSASLVAVEPLASWNESESKQAIIAFVDSVTDPNSESFVPAGERIAVFDNDGTLWAEQPVYFQLFFAADRIKALADQHPEWADQEPFASVLKDDLHTALSGGTEAILQLVTASHGNVSAPEFAEAVAQWLETARHPTTGRPYTEMVYQPMLEVLDYLRANDFTVFIVSGGGIDFMRVFAESVYGIPPHQVIGSQVVAEYVVDDGVPMIVKQPKMFVVDDKEGKPVTIHHHIGQRQFLLPATAMVTLPCWNGQPLATARALACLCTIPMASSGPTTVRVISVNSFVVSMRHHNVVGPWSIWLPIGRPFFLLSNWQEFRNWQGKAFR